jgi:hypothetical protein
MKIIFINKMEPKDAARHWWYVAGHTGRPAAVGPGRFGSAGSWREIGMVRKWNVFAVALAQGISLALAGQLPARAMIFKAGADAEEDRLREEAAHAAGAKYKCMVRICFGSKDGQVVRSGSGVYLGTGEDGKKGYILTAAHVCAFGIEELRQAGFDQVLAFAGPVPKEGQGVAMEKIFINSRFDFGPGESGKRLPESGRRSPFGRCDIALMRFEVPLNAPVTTADSLVPAILADGKDHLENTSLEAELVGFGGYGTNQGGPPAWSDRVHAGKTLVAFEGRWGTGALVNWTPVLPGVLKAYRAGANFRDLMHRFDLVDCRIKAAFPADRDSAQWIQTHPDHAVPAAGDSGGPLFMDTPVGPKVVGITSRAAGCLLLPEGTEDPVGCIGSVWEPVTSHLGWIKALQAGHPAPAWTIEPGAAGWRRLEGKASSPGGEANGKTAGDAAPPKTSAHHPDWEERCQCVIL